MMNYKLPIGVFFLIFAIFLSACVSEIKDKNNEIQSKLAEVRILSLNDRDGDGVDDFTDLLQSARGQIGVVTEYDTSYYQNGFPPENKGACSDVLWRAMQGAGYDFKRMLDSDMQESPSEYPQEPIQDKNINFRRVQNIRIYLEKHAEVLPNLVRPGDFENLKEWQAGDIVTFEQIPGGLWHVAIVSDQRREDGVPLLVHNHGYGVQENDYLTNWPSEISGHFRLR